MSSCESRGRCEGVAWCDASFSGMDGIAGVAMEDLRMCKGLVKPFIALAANVGSLLCLIGVEHSLLTTEEAVIITGDEDVLRLIISRGDMMNKCR